MNSRTKKVIGHKKKLRVTEKGANKKKTVEGGMIEFQKD